MIPVEKLMNVQRQVRDNTKTLQTYMTDLQSWESEMKRKEAALNGVFEQDLPPVRSKIKKEKPVVVKKKPENRIASYDYKSWDKFDVDKACEEVDMAEVGPTSLDGKKSLNIKQMKLREEAQYEKEKGNNFVKIEKWDEAIACYNRAIELVKDDAIYFANRGLCYLKKDSLHQAESDCSEALRLDPTYVKALQRRATAREKLGSLRAASHDLNEVLKLEPKNVAASKQLLAIKARMGTKGSKSKSSPLSTPTSESKTLPSNPSVKIVELPDDPKSQKSKTKPHHETKPKVEPLDKKLYNWSNGVGENVTIIKTVKKPPHLRSKRALKAVPIQEIPLGKTSPEKPPTRLKIIEIEDNLAHGDSNNNDSNKIDNPLKTNLKGDGDISNIKDKERKDDGDISKDQLRKGDGDICEDKVSKGDNMAEEKIVSDVLVSEKSLSVNDLVPPANSVQFMLEWKNLQGKGGARSDYMSIIDPSKIPAIFANALESDVLSEVLSILAENPAKFQEKTVAAYLKGLSQVKRFSALAMFLSDRDKLLLNKLLTHCKTAEKSSDDEIADLKNKYEL